MTPKIATCCYCGTRAALTLRGKDRHELSCSNCGAPLHELKMLRANSDAEREVRGLTPKHERPQYEARRKRKKQKKTKSLSRRFMEEMFDAAEDIFDIFD